jgi:hypothetical protein
MSTSGNVTEHCVGPGHPDEITTGPDNALWFTEFSETGISIARIPSTTTDSANCPPPGGGGPGGGSSGGSGGGPGGGLGAAPVQAAADTLAPTVTLGAARSQKLSRKGDIVVSAQCNEACTVSASAAVTVGKAAKTFRTAKVTRTLAAGKKISLRLKFPKKALRTIRRALRRKALKVTVSVSTKDRAGNTKTSKRTIRLKR